MKKFKQLFLISFLVIIGFYGNAQNSTNIKSLYSFWGGHEKMVGSYSLLARLSSDMDKKHMVGGAASLFNKEIDELLHKYEAVKQDLAKLSDEKYLNAFSNLESTYKNLASSANSFSSNLGTIKNHDFNGNLELLKNGPDVLLLEKAVKEYKERKEKERENRIGIGATAPELNLPGRDKKVITLASLRGKYVLINFWAAWGKPEAITNIADVYNTYKSHNFTVFSVSIDKSEVLWNNGIEKYGLSWPNHVCDFKGWSSPVIRTYEVRSIPHTILIDGEGKIIAKNLKKEELKEKLNSIFGL